MGASIPYHKQQKKIPLSSNSAKHGRTLAASDPTYTTSCRTSRARHQKSGHERDNDNVNDNDNDTLREGQLTSVSGLS